MNRQSDKVCAKAGTRRIGIRDLRHAWATYLLERGVDIKTISRGLCHADLSTTMRYLHAFEPVSREAADVMDTVLVDIRKAAKRRSP